MSFGIFAGPLYDRGFFRPLVCIGSTLTVLGLMVTSISGAYYQVFLAQGVCVGLGMGFTYVPILAEVSMRLSSKRRPIALGLCSTGACVGGTILPIMLRQLIGRVGFAWAVRSVAFVNLGCACGALLIVCRRPNHAYPARRLLDLSALREPPYALFTLAMFLIFLPYYVPLTYIPSFAQTVLGVSDNLAGYLLAITNAGSLLGRTMPYIIGTKVTPMRVFLVWAFASAVMLFGWSGVTTIRGFIPWCALWGFVSGALVTAPIASISHRVLSPSPAELGTRMGMSWFAAAAGELVGAPIAGALVKVQVAQYTLAQTISGAIMVLGTLCLIWPVRVTTRSDDQESSRAS